MFDCQDLILGEAEFPLLVLTGDVPLEPPIQLVLNLRGVCVLDLGEDGEGSPGGEHDLLEGVACCELGVGLD